MPSKNNPDEQPKKQPAKKKAVKAKAGGKPAKKKAVKKGAVKKKPATPRKRGLPARSRTVLADSFRMEHPIEGLFPASYNPRKITPDALESLQSSITDVGFAKPIICMPDGLIIAGHQRTKAATSLGITHVPAYVLADVKEPDQIRFNQLHNGTDMEVIDHQVMVKRSTELGYTLVAPKDIDGKMRSVGAPVRAQMCKLINIYGAWGAAIATQSGRIVGSPHYALCCKILNIPCRTYYIPDEKEDISRKWLTKVYGEFSYDHLPRNTYLQTFAQPKRLRGVIDWGASGLFAGAGRSLLYCDVAFPELSKKMRILDFGCGQGDFVKLFKKLGYKIFGIEFFYRTGDAIDKTSVHKMIDEAMADVRKNGLFDAVICDSVVNSVDTNQAESDVLTCLNAFCKMDGRIFFSGRTREGIEGHFNSTKAAVKKTTARGCEFMDDEGFSGFFRKGAWFFQKFHRREQVLKMGPQYFGESVKYTRVRKQERSWQATCNKRIELPDDQVRDAIRREFDLCWPDNHSVGKADVAIAAWEAATGRVS